MDTPPQSSGGQAAHDTNYRFTGKELDGSSGLYYYGARYYDAKLGRFITPDSIVQAPYDPQDLNRYSYARNNPLRYTDPSGYSWKGFWKTILGIATTVVSIVVPALAPAMMAVNAVIGAATAIAEGNVAGFVGGLVGGAVFGGIGRSLASSIAGTMTSAFANTFMGGAIIGAVEFGISGFGAGLGAGLASGQGLPGALKSAGMGAAFGAVTGAAIEGSYMAGWQNSVHGLSKGDVAAAQAKNNGIGSNIITDTFTKYGFKQQATDVFSKSLTSGEYSLKFGAKAIVSNDTTLTLSIGENSTVYGLLSKPINVSAPFVGRDSFSNLTLQYSDDSNALKVLDIDLSRPIFRDRVIGKEFPLENF